MEMEEVMGSTAEVQPLAPVSQRNITDSIYIIGYEPCNRAQRVYF